MRVAVTGGAGFIGSHLVDLLIKLGHEVAVLDNLSTGSSLNLNRAAQHVLCDIRDPLDGLLKSIRPEVVVHLAAQVSVAESLLNPVIDLTINGVGTCNVVTAAAGAAVRKVIFFSSAAVYGTATSLPLAEDTQTEPLSPYGLSKLTGESYVKLLCRQRGVEFTIFRPANVYGPRQTTKGDGAVIPAFLDRFLAGQDPVIEGDGSQTRDFVYVSDVARAVCRALGRADGWTLNIGTGVETSITSLWRLLAGLLGWRRSPVYAAPRPGDIRRSVMSGRAAASQLEWRPEVRLEEGLAQTVQWACREKLPTVVAERRMGG